jgi:two-component system, chemotaxis family, sensor kinase CheA
MTDSLRAAYLEEAGELLAELEVSLLELEAKPSDMELVGRVFRALHTIKGSGGMFGFDDVAAFTHELETVFDDVREGRIAVTPEIVGITLAARDHIQSLLRAAAGGESPGDAPREPLEVSGAKILERLRQAAPVSAASLGSQAVVVPLETSREVAVEAAADQAADHNSDGTRSYRIRFEPHPDIFLSGVNPTLVLKELDELGDLSLIAHVDRIPDLDQFNPESCYTYWDAVLTTRASIDAIRDVFIFVEDRALISVEPIAAGAYEHARIGDLLVERGVADKADVETTLAEIPLAGELLVQAGVVSEQQVAAAVLEQQHLDSLREKRNKSEAASTLRVPASKLDALVNIVGELVTVQARLSEFALISGDPEISFISEEVERLSELLRENAMSIRMLPIGETFTRFKRLVRDLSSELDKKVELTTEGNETELDKTVIEQLSDPLVHLIRNSVDHGIESPERRLAAGKPETGRIHLSATHAGAHVLIRVSDDGGGLNREAIRARAVERGLIAPDAQLNEQETNALIFKPGFSTAAKITGISGRGVGMDVVQRSLDALRGSLTVSSKPGKGTEVTLKIPLTLAIIDGLLVEAGGAYFVAPVSNISECIELTRNGGSGRGSLVNVRGDLVPYVSLRDRFAIPGVAPKIEQVIVAETQDGKFGVVVDRIIGDHHTVIKKLGNIYRHVEEVSGATILGDGTVALILDVAKLTAGVIREGQLNGHGV